MYVNVCKRVNTRLIGGDVGKFQNPQPGTVIDAAITDRDAVNCATSWAADDDVVVGDDVTIA
jgi:hypothetical protein